MESIEQKIKSLAEQQELKSPSADCDLRIENMIAESTRAKVPPKSKWPVWSIAASVALFSVFITFKNINDNKLDNVFQASIELESSIAKVKTDDLQPMVFMEISKLNGQIADLDNRLQTMLLQDAKQSDILALLSQRMDKLNLVKELYQMDSSAYRI